MDKQVCQVCNESFDFDTSGLATYRRGQPFLVCSSNCAKKAAKKRGRKYAIHDKSDKIVETNEPRME